MLEELLLVVLEDGVFLMEEMEEGVLMVGMEEVEEDQVLFMLLKLMPVFQF